MRAEQTGFTLVELMIALGLVSVLAVGLLAAAQTPAGGHRDQNRVQNAQDNARAALEVLAHDARLIGSPARGYGLVNGTGAGPTTLPIYWVYNDISAQHADRLDVVVPTGVMLATAAETSA